MGRDLSYAYISDKLIRDKGREKLQELLLTYDDKIYEQFQWQETYEFRNCVEGMSNRIFSFSELKAYAQELLNEEDFKALHPISMILSDMCDDDFVVISSE